MKEYKVTEKQLEKLYMNLDELSGLHNDMGNYDICVNPLDLEDAKKKLNETIRELKFLAEDIEAQPLEDTSIDKASYMFRRAETAELEAIARKWAEYFDADITIRRDNQGKNIDKKISPAEAEIGMIYAYLVALTRTCAEDEEDGGPSISEMIAIILFCAANRIKRKDLSEADYGVLFRGLDEYFRSLDHAC